MRKFLISAALIATAATAVPVAAHSQSFYGARSNYGFRAASPVREQLGEIHYRIDNAARRGAISRGEANQLFSRLQRIERLHYRYARNGVSRGETIRLRSHIQNLRHQLRSELREDRYDRRDDRRW